MIGLALTWNILAPDPAVWELQTLVIGPVRVRGFCDVPDKAVGDYVLTCWLGTRSKGGERVQLAWQRMED